MTPQYPCVHVAVPAEDAELVADRLWELGTTGVEERDPTTIERGSDADVTLVGHFADEAEAVAAVEAMKAEAAGRWQVRLEHVVGDDWKERWKEFFRPTRVGTRFVVTPSWEEYQAHDDDVVITLDPGQAFGTGTHETTRLVLAEIEGRVRGGEAVLDVGCGSGILGIGALLLGASRVVAIDVDPVAVRVAEENATVNGVRLEASTTPVEQVAGRYDLVVANIRSVVLIPMVDALEARTEAGGALVLSGLLVDEEEEVRAVFDRRLTFEARRVDGAWLALVYRGTT